jgi:hypothetical protein
MTIYVIKALLFQYFKLKIFSKMRYPLACRKKIVVQCSGFGMKHTRMAAESLSKAHKYIALFSGYICIFSNKNYLRLYQLENKLLVNYYSI